jgi:hypothetical protein
VNFYLIDGPITGYPNIPGNFVIAGSDGTPQASGVNFSAADGQFLSKDVHPLDRLVLSGGQLRTVQTVTSQSSLNIQANRPFNADSRGPIPYVIGRATNATILSPSFTNLNGVADTLVTYPATRVGQTAILVACTADNSACTALNTCDANGANCQSVFLGVTNGTDVTLTTSASVWVANWRAAARAHQHTHHAQNGYDTIFHAFFSSVGIYPGQYCKRIGNNGAAPGLADLESRGAV